MGPLKSVETPACYIYRGLPNLYSFTFQTISLKRRSPTSQLNLVTLFINEAGQLRDKAITDLDQKLWEIGVAEKIFYGSLRYSTDVNTYHYDY